MDDSMEDKTLDLIISGLLTDGGHHKQWFLEQLLIKLGQDTEQVKADLLKEDYEWEPGIAP